MVMMGEVGKEVRTVRVHRWIRGAGMVMDMLRNLKKYTLQLIIGNFCYQCGFVLHQMRLSETSAKIG